MFTSKNNKSVRTRNTIWYIFTACLFIGIGIGQLLDQTKAGTLIGLGIGFLVVAIVSLARPASLNEQQNNEPS